VITNSLLAKKKVETEDDDEENESSDSKDTRSSNEEKLSNGSREKFSPTFSDSHKSTPSKRYRTKIEGDEESLPGSKIMKPSLDQYHFLSQLKVNQPLEKLEDEIETIRELLNYKPTISISKLGKKRYFLYTFEKDQKRQEKKQSISPKSIFLNRYTSKIIILGKLYYRF
jgi:midasin (ATPase involved in ribosome maturation)